MKVEYQMFKPNGVPLRAKITLSFKGFTDPAQESQVANRSSPDLTHIVTIKEGDTLPLLCDEIYRDSKYYLKVAKANNLVDVRNLKAGNFITKKFSKQNMLENYFKFYQDIIL